jgi:hypothetical protein
MEPYIPADRIPRHLRDRFSEGILTCQPWAHLIIDASPQISVNDDNNKEEEDKDEGGEEEEEEEVTYKDEAKEQGKVMDTGNGEFVRDNALAALEVEWAPTTQAHCVAIKLLQQAGSKLFTKKKRFAALLEGQMTKALQTQLGDLEHIVREHGSIATALATSIESGTTSVKEILRLRVELDAFGEEVKKSRPKSRRNIYSE